MNSTQGIEVIIKKKGSPGETPEAAEASQETAGVSNEPGKPSSTQKQVNTLLINYGKQSLQQGFKIYTDFSSNYTLSNKIDTVTNLAADIATIAAGGWLGVAAVGFKYSTQIIDSSINNQRMQNQIQARNMMLGDIVQLGGRYTNA